MTFIKWIFGLFIAAVAAYMLFIVLNTMIQNKKKPRSFPCTYISGKCTIKPTYENCKHMGGIPIHICERRLNKLEKNG